MELLKPNETWKLCTTKTSNVWKHFLVNQNDKTKLKCVHCGYQIIWTNNSTTTLRVHLLSKSKYHGGKIIDLDKSPFGEKRPYDENKENRGYLHGKVNKVIWLCWGYRFCFLLIFWILRVHEIEFISFYSTDVVRPLQNDK